MNGGENIVEIKGIKQLTDAVYDKAKEMNHPIRKHETYWAVKAFMEVMVDVIREDGYFQNLSLLVKGSTVVAVSESSKIDVLF